MVDVRPLIFANALFLMLLVTAGFAHISDQNPLSGNVIPTTDVSEPNTASVAKTPHQPNFSAENSNSENIDSEATLSEVEDSEIFR